MLSERAPAKINLFLHVLGRREDGYHLLESLVSFADVGDVLTLDPGSGLGLSVDGPFGGALDGEPDNLVLKAARAFAAHVPKAALGRFHLTKNLPLASGIGGGSSDAAAALRLLARANGLQPDDPRLIDCARLVGADVPVCLVGGTRLMRGIGHELGPALDAVMKPALLINPGVAVETRAVFTALGLAPGGRGGAPASGDLAQCHNDLEKPACTLVPAIHDALEMLSGMQGAELVRMSGSGATCFALFGDEASRDAATRVIESKYGAMNTPRWWVAPCRISVPT